MFPCCPTLSPCAPNRSIKGQVRDAYRILHTDNPLPLLERSKGVISVLGFLFLSDSYDKPWWDGSP